MKKQLTKLIFTVSSLLIASSAASAAVPYLCRSNETQLFACSARHQNQLKYASVCASDISDSVVYRFISTNGYAEKEISIDPRRFGAQMASGRLIPGNNSYLLSVKFDEAGTGYSFEVSSDDHGSAGVTITRNGQYLAQVDCIEGNYFDKDQLSRSFPLSDNFEELGGGSSQSYSHASSQQPVWSQQASSNIFSKIGRDQATFTSYILNYLAQYQPNIRQELANAQQQGYQCEHNVNYTEITSNSVNTYILCKYHSPDYLMESATLVHMNFSYNPSTQNLDLIRVYSDGAD